MFLDFLDSLLQWYDIIHSILSSSIFNSNPQILFVFQDTFMILFVYTGRYILRSLIPVQFYAITPNI